MSRPVPYPFEPPASKAGHKGLTERLARRAAERDRLLLPVYCPPQVKDKAK
jgi:hypothetical protein